MKVLSGLFFCGVILGLSCCVGQKKNLKDQKTTYLESVKINFDAGNDALSNKEYDKAIGYFQFVRSKYPFSMYAALSDLKIADIKYEQEKWLDAAAAYEVFIRLHPRHEEVALASYRLGLSYFYAVPKDSFITPKASTRDQSFTKDALAALERFIAQFPNSPHQQDAQAKRGILYSYLAQHHQYIAEYYVTRKHYQAAIDRYLLVEELYPESDEVARSLYEAAELLRIKLKDYEKARELYQRIVELNKNAEYAEKAKTRLDELAEQSE